MPDMSLSDISVSACDKVQDFLSKGDDNTTGESEEAISPLRRVVRFKGKPHLNDTEAEQDNIRYEILQAACRVLRP